MTKIENKKASPTAVSGDFPPSVDHDMAIIEELKADPAYAEIYLQTALEDIYEEGGVAAFMTALRRVVEARGGIGEIAQKSGLSRQQLYKTLSASGNPRLTTLAKITRAAGVRLTPHTS